MKIEKVIRRFLLFDAIDGQWTSREIDNTFIFWHGGGMIYCLSSRQWYFYRQFYDHKVELVCN